MKAIKHITCYNSPLGKLWLGSNGQELTNAWIEGQAHAPAASLTQNAADGSQVPVLQAAAKWLDAYFAGKQPGELPAMRLDGSFTSLAVWDALTQIPAGTTVSYGQLAKQIEEATGLSINARVVGNAVAHNPVLVLIPCHRVVGSDGSLTGFAAGLDNKQWLLNHENAAR